MSKGCLRIQILTLLTPSHKFHRTGQGAHDIAGADGRTDDKTKDGQAAGSRRAARRTDRPTDAAATRLVPRSSATTAAAAGGKPDNLQFHPHLANNAQKGKYSLFPYLGEAVSSTSQSSPLGRSLAHNTPSLVRSSSLKFFSDWKCIRAAILIAVTL